MQMRCTCIKYHSEVGLLVLDVRIHFSVLGRNDRWLQVCFRCRAGGGAWARWYKSFNLWYSKPLQFTNVISIGSAFEFRWRKSFWHRHTKWQSWRRRCLFIPSCLFFYLWPIATKKKKKKRRNAEIIGLSATTSSGNYQSFLTTTFGKYSSWRQSGWKNFFFFFLHLQVAG